MTTAIYDQDLKLSVVYHNNITDEGSRLQKMLVNVSDSNTLLKAEVKQAESFNWFLKPKTPWYLSFSIKIDEVESQEIVSERNVEPEKVQLTFNGETYECLVIKESTMINLVSNNRTRSEEQQRTSYFAKGVGLVQYETFYANGTSELFKLSEIIIDKNKDMLVPVKKDSTAIVQ
jgi:hypothetical protein